MFSGIKWIDNFPDHKNKKIDRYEQSEHGEQLEITDDLPGKKNDIRSSSYEFLPVVSIQCKVSHFEKLSLNISCLSFVIRVNILHPSPSLFIEICPGLNANEVQIPYDKHNKVSS